MKLRVDETAVSHFGCRWQQGIGYYLLHLKQFNVSTSAVLGGSLERCGETTLSPSQIRWDQIFILIWISYEIIQSGRL